MKNIADLIARILISGVFIYEAIDSMLFFEQTKVQMSLYHINWQQDLLLIACISILITGGVLILIGYRAELSLWYYISVAIAAGMMAYHLWLARDRQKEGCFAAFLHNHYIGMVVFIGIVLHYTFHPVTA